MRGGPCPFHEEYVKHYDEAKNAWRKLHLALGQLQQAVAQVNQSPTILGNPSNQPWPTQDELRKMFTEPQQKSVPLMGEWSQLPGDVKTYAPNPNQVSLRER